MAKRKDPAAVQLGRRGGKARLKKMTAAERSKVAKMGAAARWLKPAAPKKEGKRMAVQKVRISALHLDFQPAENLDDEKVLFYIEKLKSGEALEPVTVCFDGEGYFLKDGFHRVAASSAMGRRVIEAEVTPGTLAEMEREWRDALELAKAELSAWAKTTRAARQKAVASKKRGK